MHDSVCVRLQVQYRGLPAGGQFHEPWPWPGAQFAQSLDDVQTRVAQFADGAATHVHRWFWQAFTVSVWSPPTGGHT